MTVEPTRRTRPPSVERLLTEAREELRGREHDAVVDAARAVIADERERLAAGSPPRAGGELATALVARLDAFRIPGPTTLINGTGVLIHTNIGRAPWAEAAIAAANRAAGAPSFLELDPASGRRGSRYRLAEEHLIALTRAEDAFITNNNAAALALAVGLAGRGGVLVSRGELVEIGGGVRIPDIVRRAGAKLIEVGTTNRTRAEDFAGALVDGRARLILRVHPSNFRQDGFVEAPDPVALAELAHAHHAVVIDDVGSGALLATEAFGLAHEPTPAERLAAGADLVTFSGDKLVGGPQAGLVVGRADLVARLRKDPLARATRPDKVTLAAVAATLGLYRAGLAVREVPVWKMIAARPDDLRARAEALVARLDDPTLDARPAAMASTIGGGSLPGETLPSWGASLGGRSADALLARLRRGKPAVVGRIEADRVLIDLRTVDPLDDPSLTRAIAAAVAAVRRTGPP